VAALTLTGQSGRSPAPTPPDGASENTLVAKDARQVLLAAATQAEAAQPGTGRYWLHKTEDRHVYNAGDYKIVGRSAQEIWSPMSTQDSYVHCSRWLGFQPLTEADRAAWERAGSPASLKANPKQPAQTLTLGPGQRECKARPSDGDDNFYIAGVPYTLEQLRALPADPAQLREALWRAIPGVDAELLFLAAGDILLRMPAPPALRAAAYRMLADLPGIGYVEGVTDILGRTGSGVEHTFANNARVVFTTRLVIDLRTGQTLAHESRDGSQLLYSDAVISSELTDQAPPRA